MEEKKYYYRDGINLGVTKHKLSEEERGNYVEITEEEYNTLIEQIKDRGNLEQSQINLKRNRILELKCLLDDSDYKQHKWLDGEISDEDYAPVKAQRHAWRVEINQLEQEIENAQ